VILWILLVLCVAVLLTIGIERLIARLGVRNEDTAPTGLAVLAERLERWASDRRRVFRLYDRE